MPELRDVIQAAGAVLWRTKGKTVEIALVHRPRYDDWSLPKGKLEANESHIACAFREVLEETGVTPIFGPELGQAIYLVPEGEKVVRYWAAQASDVPYGEPDAAEIDEVLWLTPGAAKKKLTLEDDQEIVDFFLDFGPNTIPLVLLRHAKAVRREDWDGDDGDRPLDVVGQRQAKRLLPLYLPYALKEIHTSDAMRCLETVQPIARALEIKTITSKDISEYGYAMDKELSLIYVQQLFESSLPALICSHNPVIPKLVKKILGKKNFKKLDEKLSPGEAWILHHRDGEIIAVDLIEAPNI